MGATMDDRLAMYASRPGRGLQGGANVPLSASLRGFSSIPPLQSSFGNAQLESASYRRSPVQGALTMLDDPPSENQTGERIAVSDDFVRMQGELQANRAEETRLRNALQMHESVIQKNREELNRYRAYMDTRDNEMRQVMQLEEDRLQKVLDEYRHRYERERQRLQEALVQAANCAQVVSDGLTQCLAIERELFGYRSVFALPAPSVFVYTLSAQVEGRTCCRSVEELRTQRRPVPPDNAPSLLQAMGGMSIDQQSVNSYGGSGWYAQPNALCFTTVDAQPKLFQYDDALTLTMRCMQGQFIDGRIHVIRKRGLSPYGRGDHARLSPECCPE